MIICDEYLALAALSENFPISTAAGPVAITPAAWSRVLRSRHRVDDPRQVAIGQLSELISRLSPDGRAKLAMPDPSLLEIVDPRPFLDTAARLAVSYRLSYMAAEMASAALFHRAPLHFASELNVPPGIRALLQYENLPGIHIIVPA